MTTGGGHSPSEFVAELGQKLASRGRRVSLLLGAGTSRACGLPDVAGLETEVLGTLEPADQTRLRSLLKDNNLEEVLSRLRRISALLGSTSQKVDSLTGSQAGELDKAICAAIAQALRLERADLAAMRDLARWVARRDYQLPVELFTVNYDLLLEAALEEERAWFFDGFVGVYEARFQVDLVDAASRNQQDPLIASAFTRLWKLHGSVNWIWADGLSGEVLRLGVPAPADKAAAIYPADTKYEESRRVPFVVLNDRFRRRLLEPESLVLVTGYSFSDDHLNELIFEAAARRPRSEFLAFFFEDMPTSVIEVARRTPNLSLVAPSEAVLGCERADWIAPPGEVPCVWEAGKFAMGDFRQLARHLSRTALEVGDAA